MTDSIDIPKRKGKQRAGHPGTPASAYLSASASETSSPQTPSGSLFSFGREQSRLFHLGDPSTEHIDDIDAVASPGLSVEGKGKMPLREKKDAASREESRAAKKSRSQGHERRPSLLSSSLSKSEHTVVNIGEPDRPRLITCVKASQGFDWNQDIFFPAYVYARDQRRGDYQAELERRQDPVEDIFISDEEAQMMFPVGD